MHDPNYGHNSAGAVQWQVPHDPDHEQAPPASSGEADLDLVETAFIQGFAMAEDPTSFLRLAGIPFKADRGGRTLNLLRVESSKKTDLASLTPLLGGKKFRHDPLPKQMVSCRDTLIFCYFDGEAIQELRFQEARELKAL